MFTSLPAFQVVLIIFMPQPVLGLFFMMTNGLGAIIGGYASGAVVDAFSVYADGRLVSREWMDIWLIFAAYALVIGILFALVFKYKHQQESKTN